MAAGDEKDCADRRRRYGYSMESRRRDGCSRELRRQHSFSTESRRQCGYSTESRQESGMGSGRNSDRRNPRRNIDRQRDCYTPRSRPRREERDEDDREYREYMERRRKYVERRRRLDAVARRYGVEPLDRPGLSPNRYTDPDPDRCRRHCIHVKFSDYRLSDWSDLEPMWVELQKPLEEKNKNGEPKPEPSPGCQYFNKPVYPDPDCLRSYCVQLEIPDSLPQDIEAWYQTFFPTDLDSTPEDKRPRMITACDPDIHCGFFAKLSPKHVEYMKTMPHFMDAQEEGPFQFHLID